MEKIKVSYYITKNLNSRLNKLSREILPNKSKLIEELLEKWIEKQENNGVEKKVS